MRHESKDTATQTFSRIIQVVFLVSALLFSEILSAQNRIGIYRYSFDEILITNQESHSITVQAGYENRFIISGRSTRRIPFALNYSHVTETPFVVSYDYDSFRNDSLICANLSRGARRQNDNFISITGIVYALYHKGMQFEKAISLIKVIALLMGIPTPKIDVLCNNLLEIWQSKAGEDQKEIEMMAIVKTYFDLSEEVERDRSDCVDNAKQLLNQVKPSTYYAYQFIRMQEKSRFEITPFGLVGYRTKLFKGVGDKNTIQRMDIRNQAYYGLRTALVVNAYNKYHKRKVDTKYYFPVTISKSPVVYKDGSYNDVFSENKAYSWLTYSLGFGWEFNYFNTTHTRNTHSGFLDIGLVSSTLKQYNRDSTRLSDRSTVSSFKGAVPYLNAGYKVRLTNWLDLYGAYYTTFLYGNLKYDKKDMPSFRQFNVGLNFNLARHFSYQY